MFHSFLQWSSTVELGRNYLIAATLEVERRRLVQEEPTNVQRGLELAAYFTHCDLLPPHKILALRNGIQVANKAKNTATAARFGRRLLELKPEAAVVNAVSLTKE